jgi:mono/diheme cytochrome c family protein
LGPVSTTADAAGAVDGVKNGKYAFHTGGEPNPWWQVDLGESVSIARIVVYNRLDYAPGLHNADNLVILTSDDGRTWLTRYENRGKHFGGVSGAKPLEVTFPPGQVRSRWVRLQVPGKTPILFHLDEVEVYAQADPAKNIALGKPADQSSVSIWSTPKRYIDPNRPIAYPTKEVLERGRRLAVDIQAMGADARPSLRELDEIEARSKQLPDTAPAETQRQMYLKARWAVRRLAMANPLVRFDRLLFVKRFTQQCYPDICLNHMPWVSRPGGDLCVLENPFSLDGTGQRVRNLLGGSLGPGHVHGMDLGWDAGRVVFGYAKSKTGQPPFAWPPGHCVERYLAHKLRESEEPTHIFEIGVDGRGLRQLTRHGYWSDLDPTYLPNGDVAFVSERCGYSLQCNHDPHLDETSCNLYVIRPDGSNIRRLSVNKDGDYLPHCLDDGTIGYTRWEYQERGLTQIQSLWSVRPDGTWADAIFKQHLNDPWALEDVRSIPGTGSNKLVAIAAGHHTLAAGPVVVLTPSVGLNDPRAIRSVTPWVLPPEGGMSGTAVAEGGVCDDGGYYMSPWALSEKYFLVSYSSLKTQPQGFPEYCRGADEKGYALYLIDVFGNKELIYRDPEISSFTAIPLRPRPRPPILPDQTDPAQKFARCVLSDVGYGVPGVPRERIRYLRIAQGVPWPYDREHGGHRYEHVALNTGLGWTPVRILGTVPIEADGSAHFQVPADEAVYFQLLDENQMELRRMRSFISFQPGEVRGCVGCHESRPAAPTAAPGPLAAQRDPSVPIPPPWGDRPLSFLRDVQPVFDRHCAACHSGLKPAAGFDFSGGLVGETKIRTTYGGELALDGHNRAYRTLIAENLVSYANKYDPADAVTQPLAFGSHQSKLVRAIREGACAKRAALSPDDRLRLVTWIDANAPYHHTFINMRPEKPPYDLPSDRELTGKIAAVHGRRCGACHEAEEVSRPDWIDLRQPQKSLFLVAPLAKESGGTGKCRPAVYKAQTDADYRALRGLVETAVKRAWAAPRRDLEALVGSSKTERTAQH